VKSTESLPALVGRLRWDRRRHPHSGRREYSRAARQVAAQADRVLSVGGAEDRRALVPVLRTAVNRVTAALHYLDDSSGSIGDDLRALMELYARACCAAPPSSPASLAKWLVEMVWDGPGWPEVRLTEFAPALGPKGLARVADLVARRTDGADPDSWHDQWAGEYLREQLAAASGDVDHHVAVLAEDLKHPDRYRTIATVLRDDGRPADAVEWTRRGLAHHPTNPYSDRLRDLLVDLLIDLDDPDGALQERRTDYERRPITTAYCALTTTARRVSADPGQVTEWALDVLRSRVAEDPRYVPNLVTALLTENRIDEAWVTALPHHDDLSETGLLDLLAARAPTYPADVLEPYRRLIEGHILDSGDKWRYERALKLLPSLHAAHRALGDDDGWSRYLDDLRDRHRIRPTFLRKLAAWQDGTSPSPGRRGRLT
jgi:hypothetical protein